MTDRDALLEELRSTKSEIDRLQERLKAIVAALRDAGMDASEIGAFLRGD